MIDDLAGIVKFAGPAVGAFHALSVPNSTPLAPAYHPGCQVHANSDLSAVITSSDVNSLAICADCHGSTVFPTPAAPWRMYGVLRSFCVEASRRAACSAWGWHRPLGPTAAGRPDRCPCRRLGPANSALPPGRPAACAGSPAPEPSPATRVSCRRSPGPGPARTGAHRVRAAQLPRQRRGHADHDPLLSSQPPPFQVTPDTPAGHATTRTSSPGTGRSRTCPPSWPATSRTPSTSGTASSGSTASTTSARWAAPTAS